MQLTGCYYEDTLWFHLFQRLPVKSGVFKVQGKESFSRTGALTFCTSGHIDLLTRARGLGDALVVAINTNASVVRMKGPSRPIIPQDERAELLSGLEMVDFVSSTKTPLASNPRDPP